MKVPITALFCISCLTSYVYGHGRLFEPPGRSTAWRFGFNTTINYNDNELNCGGFWNQWNQQGGRCGLCGDPYQGPRDHEAGGKYATGTIVETYASGSEMEVTLEITANHKGYHEFRLCKNDDPSRPITQECLDQHLLHDVFSGETRLYMDSVENTRFTWILQLPPGLTCTQCVLQWKWHCGNNWGTDPDGTSGLGHGPQEQFYGCADIAIYDDGDFTGELNDPEAGTTEGETAPLSTIIVAAATAETATTTTTTTTTTTRATTTTAATTTTTEAPTVATAEDADDITRARGSNGCRSAGAYEGQSWIDDWCVRNCAATPPNCPATHCICDTVTTAAAVTTEAPPSVLTQGSSAVGSIQQDPVQIPVQVGQASRPIECRPSVTYAAVPGMTNWCVTNCGQGYCPPSHCSCRAAEPRTSPRRCSAVGIWRTVSTMNKWCETNCNRNPPNCPGTHCECS